MSAADDRGEVFAALAEAAAIRSPTRVWLDTVADVPPGFALWRLGRVSTCLRMIRLDSPLDVQQRYWAYVSANLAGHCWLCDAVISVYAEPEHHPTTWSELPVRLHVPHDPECAAVFRETDAEWLADPDWRPTP